MSKYQSLGHLRQDGATQAINFAQHCTYDQIDRYANGAYFPDVRTLTIPRDWQWTIGVRNPSPRKGTHYICADMILQMKGFIAR